MMPKFDQCDHPSTTKFFHPKEPLNLFRVTGAADSLFTGLSPLPVNG